MADRELAPPVHVPHPLLLPLPRAGEEARWIIQSKDFDASIQRLTGDCAIACGFVSYLGPFNREFRELLMKRDIYGDCNKLNIPVTQVRSQAQAAAAPADAIPDSWRALHEQCRRRTTHHLVVPE